jgi:eukaryotic-like serine/threonine-protein kinase
MGSPLSPGTKLGRYEIRSQIGKGGMGEVYLAQDYQLERTVALKILPENVATDQTRLQRFVQEAKSASGLNHPNILTVYEIGQAASLHFIASEYIEGETLRQHLVKGPMSLNEVLDICIQVANALATAHKAGIIHRDIKPENIMIRRDGIVKVLDFGLAKLIARVDPEQNIDTQAATKVLVQTEPGILMGTVTYMSPEQARGKSLDARTDIFSFGVVIYELISGHAPFAGDTPSDVIAAILKTDPPPLANENNEVPRELEHLVRKCLAKDREQRYSSAHELLIDLKNPKREFEARATWMVPVQEGQRKPLVSRRSFALSILSIAVIGGLSYPFLFRRASTTPEREIKSLAVLPLVNLSGDPAQEYFADGMTEALISNLAQIHALDRVISRTSVMRYKGSLKSLPEIAAELKVDAVIEGTVRRSGDRVVVTAKLIRAATDSPEWTREYSRDLSDVLKLQSDVARSVADEIRVQVTPEERTRLAAARNINPQAHEAYLLGRHHLRTNEDDLRQAIEHFERAIKLEPDYAAAYAGLSRAWDLRGIWGAKNLKEVRPFALDAALKALSRDSQLAEGHSALAVVKLYDWDWSGAEEEFRRALELDPNSARAHQEYADLLMQLERHDEAIREIQRAEDLDPFSSYIQSRYGRVLYRARKYEEALPHVQRALDLDPNPGNAMPHWILGELYVQMGRYDEAIASFRKYLLHSGRTGSGTAGIRAAIARAYALMGKRTEARRMIEELKATIEPARFANATVAHAYVALGDKDEAFKVLFRLVEERRDLTTTIKADPPLESLHSDPRWKELLRRMNLE